MCSVSIGIKAIAVAMVKNFFSLSLSLSSFFSSSYANVYFICAMEMLLDMDTCLSLIF